MNTEVILALYLFVLVAIFTPGPNNMMLLASGANFGVRRTLPHMAGITIGHAGMVVILGLGLTRLLDAFPSIFAVLEIACLAYLLWLAWRIANAAPPEGAQGAGRPLTFVQAAGFQWVNPKAWAVALTAVTAYAPGEGLAAVLVTALVFLTVSVPSVSLWAGLGTGLRRWLGTGLRLRIFNRTMAVLLVLSTLPVLF